MSFRMKEIIERMNRLNDGTRPLLESIAVPEVTAALKDWISSNSGGVLIGGLAMSYYGKPRMTMDIDVLFLSPSDIPPNVGGFKRTRAGAFQHNDTHVEVEVVSADSINIPEELVRQVFKTAILVDGFLVASPSGIVALKLQRLKNNDIGDIVQMINTGKVDLIDFPLSNKNLEDFDEISRRFV